MADRAFDRRRRVGSERDASTRIEAITRFDQPDRADLNQIVERFTPAGVAARDGMHQGQVRLNQVLPRILGGVR